MVAIAVILFVASGIVPVMADTEIPWTGGYHQIYLAPTNGIRFNATGNGTYYFKLSGGGLNALHISNDPKNITKGQFTTTSATSGTFWITDTGGRGYHDDALLLIAVNGTTPLTTRNFTVHITSSGYNWTPTGDGLLPPEGVPVYNASALNNVAFSTGNFLLNSSTPIDTYWRPSTQSTFPVFYNEYMNFNPNNFRFILVDLKVGVIGTGNTGNSTYAQNLTDWGAANVTYSITRPTGSFVAFAAYSYTNQSNQGQGVSWTTDSLGSSGYPSGWLVTS